MTSEIEQPGSGSQEFTDFFDIDIIIYNGFDGNRYTIEIHYVHPDDLPGDLSYLADYVGHNHPYVRALDSNDEIMGEGILFHEEDEDTLLRPGKAPSIGLPNPNTGNWRSELMLPHVTSFEEVIYTDQ